MHSKALESNNQSIKLYVTDSRILKENLLSGITIFQQPPVFSVVIALHNNSEYAKDLYRSFEKQSVNVDLCEFILIDDGSTDNTLLLAKEWKARSRHIVKVISKPNGGVASARNLGIKNAAGDWIAFVDSDDLLHRDYFKSLYQFIQRDRHGSVSMLTSRSIIFNEDTGITQDNHPLSWKYKRGDRLVSLNLEPHIVHLGGHSTIVRRRVVTENGLLFNMDVNPGFEDADFNGRYLSTFDEPILGLVASARYFYRKRSSKTSLIDTAWIKPEKFTNEPRYGHLGMLEEVTRRLGYTPKWAQNTVLYALYWYFTADRSWKDPFRSVDQVILDNFWGTLDQIFSYIDEDTIREFSLMNYGWYLTEGVLRQFKDTNWSTNGQYALYKWGSVDWFIKTQKYVYSYKHEQPEERFFIDGIPVQPIYSKTTPNLSFGHVLMHERVLLLPARGKLRAELNGEVVPTVGMPKFNKRPMFLNNVPSKLKLEDGDSVVSPQELLGAIRKGSLAGWDFQVSRFRAFWAKSREEAWVNGTGTLLAGAGIAWRVGNRVYRKRHRDRQVEADRRLASELKKDTRYANFDDAWIFIDRSDRADDNAEHLFRYVKNVRPDINAWFMIEEGTRDWERLSREGFRLIAHGSEAAIAASLRARFILSSHLDGGSYDLVDPKRYGKTTARRVFLQHGMTMNDISKWTNTKIISLFTTCSIPEYDAVTRDGSRYKLSKREVKLTGFPRHDRLVELGYKNSVSDRKTVLVIPTWRKELSQKLASATDDQERYAILSDSDFYGKWSNLLVDPDFDKLMDDAGLTVKFVLHDHLTKFASLFSFDGKVELVSYSSISIQQELVEARLVITDYSSIATEAAIAGSSVFYYQFDIDHIYGGGHSFDRDWFDYAEHGFGPVCTTSREVVDMLTEASTRNWESDLMYKERLHSTMPHLDGTSSARVLEAVFELDIVRQR